MQGTRILSSPSEAATVQPSATAPNSGSWSHAASPYPPPKSPAAFPYVPPSRLPPGFPRGSRTGSRMRPGQRAGGPQGPRPTEAAERRAARLWLWTRRRARVTLEDSQEAVGSQVALGVVAELQSLRGAAAPPAGPLLSLRRERSGVAILPGGARPALPAGAGAGWLKHRVLDTATLHSTERPMSGTSCKRRLAATLL